MELIEELEALVEKYRARRIRLTHNELMLLGALSHICGSYYGGDIERLATELAQRSLSEISLLKEKIRGIIG